jgi:hypothetical protein
MKVCLDFLSANNVKRLLIVEFIRFHVVCVFGVEDILERGLFYGCFIILVDVKNFGKLVGGGNGQFLLGEVFLAGVLGELDGQLVDFG